MKHFSENDSIRAKIRGYQLTSGLIRRRCEKATGDKKHQMKLYKKECGQEARHYLVALGLLRGFKYSTIEQNCSSTHTLNPVKLTSIMNDHKYMGLPKFEVEYIQDLLKDAEPSHVFNCTSCNKKRLPLRCLKNSFTVKMRALASVNQDVCKTCALRERKARIEEQRQKVAL